MLRHYLIFLICIFSFLHGEDNQSVYIKAKPEESLFLRRVVEYWEEGSLEIVKREMHRYLNEYEKSPFTDYLLALLGDIYLTEKDFAKAKELYERIEHDYLKNRTFINYLQSLQQTAAFEQIITESEKYFQNYGMEDPRLIYLVADSYYQLGYGKEDEESKLKLAQELFTKLLKTEMSEKALLPLAHISERLKDFPSASEFYLLLAKRENQKDPEKYLFLAAQTTALYDKAKAIEMFREVCHRKGQRAEDAAYNLFLLAMEEKEYKKVIEEAPFLLHDLDAEKVSFVYYLIGKSYFCLEDYANAVKELKRYLKLEDKKSDQMRSALALIMQCAEKLDDIKLFNFAYSHFATFFPDDQDLAKALFAKGLFHKKQKDYETALADFEKIVAEFPTFQEESFSYEQAHLLYQMKNYKEVIEVLEKSIGNEKDEQMQNQMLRLCINSYIHLKKENTEDLSEEKLSQTIEKFLEQVAYVTDTEKLQLTYLLAQMQVDRKKYDEAKENLLMLAEAYPTCEQIGPINYLLALCCHEGKKDLIAFCDFAETALQTKNVDHAEIHLSLFNVYLERANEDKGFYALAAKHLYEAQKEIEVQKNNLLWLGEYYFELANKTVENYDENLKISQSVLEKILFSKNELVFDETFLDFEKAVLNLAHIYSLTNQDDKKLDLLQNLVKFYEKKVGFSWKRLSETYYALAETYERTKEKDKAIYYYDKVLSQNQKSQEHFFADLYRTRLILQKMPKEGLIASNPEALQCLNELKNLKIQKRIETEPVHLEAALDYVDLTLKMEKEINEAKRIALLEKTKRDFSSQDDIISQDYHMKKQKLPEKSRLIDAYLLFIDAKIKCSQYLLDRTSSNKEKALASIYQIKEQELPLTPYLVAKIDECMKVLTQE